VPEIIDPVFAKTSQNARFLLSENERFELVFVKTGSINSGTVFARSTIIFDILEINYSDYERRWSSICGPWGEKMKISPFSTCCEINTID
jgi:hypothetical protein